jgi:hypothetical protein
VNSGLPTSRPQLAQLTCSGDAFRLIRPVKIINHNDKVRFACAPAEPSVHLLADSNEKLVSPRQIGRQGARRMGEGFKHGKLAARQIDTEDLQPLRWGVKGQGDGQGAQPVGLAERGWASHHKVPGLPGSEGQENRRTSLIDAGHDRQAGQPPCRTQHSKKARPTLRRA